MGVRLENRQTIFNRAGCIKPLQTRDRRYGDMPRKSRRGQTRKGFGRRKNFRQPGDYLKNNGMPGGERAFGRERRKKSAGFEGEQPPVKLSA